MTFGVAVTLPWWLWLLMVLGAGFCWALGAGIAAKLLSKLG